MTAGLILFAIKISTHTLRKEGDISSALSYIHSAAISTHTLRKEGDNMVLPPF